MHVTFSIETRRKSLTRFNFFETMADSFELQIVNPVESRELRVEWLRARCNVRIYRTYTGN